MGPYQRTPKEVARAIAYSGLGVHSVGPVGDFLDSCLMGRLTRLEHRLQPGHHRCNPWEVAKVDHSAKSGIGWEHVWAHDDDDDDDDDREVNVTKVDKWLTNI